MNEIISAIIFNLRATLGKSEKMKEEIKRVRNQKVKIDEKFEIEFKQKLNEATAVIIIFDDLSKKLKRR